MLYEGNIQVLKTNKLSPNRVLIILLILYFSIGTVQSWSTDVAKRNSRFATSIGKQNQRHTTIFTSLALSPTRRFYRQTKLSSTVDSEDLEMTNSLQGKYIKGKNVLLTGASGGLGRSLALQISSCGVNTIILSARKEEALQKVAQECRDAAKACGDNSLKVEIVMCDLADPNAVTNLAEEALKICPNIDILINNGGVSSRSRFVDTKLDIDQRVMQINFFAGAALAKAVVPGMVTRKQGCILWISSVQGLVGIPNRSSYAASKFAVQGYCEALRAELASSGISVHVASPGYIRTNLSMSAVTGDGKNYGKLDETTANGADPDEVAVTILNSVAKGKADFVVAATFSAVAAIWMRLLFPSFLQNLLVKRYEKSVEKSKDD